MHNSSLEVNYSQSAAQVLQLIEELQYRLKSRIQVMSALQNYYANHKKIPELNQLENILPDITADQIATHFDSYFGYLEATLTGQYDQAVFRTLCIDYARDFYQKHHIYPTFKAISLSNKYKSLPACSEPEVKFLLGSEAELKNHLFGQSKSVETSNQLVDIHPPIDKAKTTEINDEFLLIDKYSTLIKTRQDLLGLSNEQRAEIKKIFNSEFRFLNCLQDKSKNV